MLRQFDLVVQSPRRKEGETMSMLHPANDRSCPARYEYFGLLTITILAKKELEQNKSDSKKTCIQLSKLQQGTFLTRHEYPLALFAIPC